MSEVAVHRDFLGVFGVAEKDGCFLLAGNRRRLREGASKQLVFDLPGGRVEAGERLEEALHREFLEECGCEVEVGEFLFVQEGIRFAQGQLRYAWRSFFFATGLRQEPRPSSEVESLLWSPRAKLTEILHAPYHAGFVRWLEDGAPLQRDEWRDDT